MGGRTALLRTIEIYSLLNEAGATSNGSEVNVEDTGLLVVHLIAASAWDGTINFEALVESGNFVVIQGENIANGTLITTATGPTLNAIFRFDVSGIKTFRTRVSGRTVGTITARARGIPV